MLKQQRSHLKQISVVNEAHFPEKAVNNFVQDHVTCVSALIYRKLTGFYFENLSNIS